MNSFIFFIENKLNFYRQIKLYFYISNIFIINEKI